jgi:hypothetical protein
MWDQDRPGTSLGIHPGSGVLAGFRCKAGAKAGQTHGGSTSLKAKLKAGGAARPERHRPRGREGRLRDTDQFGQLALAQASPTAEGGKALTERITRRQVPTRELQVELLEDGVPRVEVSPALLKLAEGLVGQPRRGG